MNVIVLKESDLIANGQCLSLLTNTCAANVTGAGLNIDQCRHVLESAITWLEDRAEHHLINHIKSINCNLVMSKRVNARVISNGDVAILSGLIDLFSWYSTLAAVVYTLADVSLGLEGAKKIIDKNILQILSFEFLPVLYGTDMDILLKLNSFLSEQDKYYANEQMCAAIAFVISHEIGHIALGHCNDGGDGPTNVPTILEITEALSSSSNLEIEADLFAISGVSSRFASEMFRSTETLFTTLAIAEAVQGKGSVDHPFITNRLATVYNSIHTDDQNEVSLNLKYMKKLALFHEEVSRLRKNRKFETIFNPDGLICFCNEALSGWSKGFT